MTKVYSFESGTEPMISDTDTDTESVRQIVGTDHL